MGSEQFIWQHGDPICHGFLFVVIRHVAHRITDLPYLNYRELRHLS